VLWSKKVNLTDSWAAIASNGYAVRGQLTLTLEICLGLMSQDRGEMSQNNGKQILETSGRLNEIFEERNSEEDFHNGEDLLVFFIQDRQLRIKEVKENPISMSFGGTVWDSAKTFLRLFEHDDFFSMENLRGKRVLELGSGTGIVGLALALLGAQVTLTDKPCLVPLLIENIHLNFDPSQLAEDHLPRAVSYQWGQSVESLSPPYDIIVGSDITYAQESQSALLEAFRSLALPNLTTCFIAEEEYVEDILESWFWNQLKKDFCIEHYAVVKSDSSTNYCTEDVKGACSSFLSCEDVKIIKFWKINVKKQKEENNLPHKNIMLPTASHES